MCSRHVLLLCGLAAAVPGAVAAAGAGETPLRTLVPAASAAAPARDPGAGPPRTAPPVASVGAAWSGFAAPQLRILAPPAGEGSGAGGRLRALAPAESRSVRVPGLAASPARPWMPAAAGGVTDLIGDAKLRVLARAGADADRGPAARALSLRALSLRALDPAETGSVRVPGLSPMRVAARPAPDRDAASAAEGGLRALAPAEAGVVRVPGVGGSLMRALMPAPGRPMPAAASGEARLRPVASEAEVAAQAAVAPPPAASGASDRTASTGPGQGAGAPSSRALAPEGAAKGASPAPGGESPAPSGAGAPHPAPGQSEGRQVRVGDIVGLPLIDPLGRPLGYVRALARSRDGGPDGDREGGIVVVTPLEQRLVGVPLAAVTILKTSIAIDMPLRDLYALPPWTGAGQTILSARDSVRLPGAGPE